MFGIRSAFVTYLSGFFPDFLLIATAWLLLAYGSGYSKDYAIRATLRPFACCITFNFFQHVLYHKLHNFQLHIGGLNKPLPRTLYSPNKMLHALTHDSWRPKVDMSSYFRAKKPFLMYLLYHFSFLLS